MRALPVALGAGVMTLVVGVTLSNARPEPADTLKPVTEALSLIELV